QDRLHTILLKAGLSKFTIVNKYAKVYEWTKFFHLPKKYTVKRYNVFLKKVEIILLHLNSGIQRMMKLNAFFWQCQMELNYSINLLLASFIIINKLALLIGLLDTRIKNHYILVFC